MRFKTQFTRFKIKMKTSSNLGSISGSAFDSLIRRFPKINVSYETTLQDKISSDYDICLAIPLSKKYFAWFSFYNNTNVCFLMVINRYRKIESITIVNTKFKADVSRGTILYGSMLDDLSHNNDKNVSHSDLSCFIIEDIIMFKGISMSSLSFGDKLGYIHSLLKNDLSKVVETAKYGNKYNSMIFLLPVIITIPDDVKKIEFKDTAYQIHHIQYRSLSKIVPYINTSVPNTRTSPPCKVIENIISIPEEHYQHHRCDFSKPQYLKKTIFIVKACLQYDIYNLFVMSKNNTTVLYDVAYISNYKLSVFMNNQFRNIRENANIDCIEESDDEDDFQDGRYDKYANLTKSITMECVFNIKFKRWVPERIVSERNPRIVYDHNLLR